MSPRPHADIIKLWADGAEIQGRSPESKEWQDISDPAFVKTWEYRVKPVREYPKSSMTGIELEAVWMENYPNMGEETSRTLTECRRACADEVLRHAIDNNQVAPMSEVQQTARELAKQEVSRIVMTGRDDRDMAIAKAVGQYLSPSLKLWNMKVPDDDTLRAIVADIQS